MPILDIPPTMTPESIVAEISDDLVSAINQGVPRIFRGLVGKFGGKVVAWAIGLLVLKTAAWAYPALLVIEPFAVAVFQPFVSRWFTAAKTLYASKPGVVQGVNLASIVKPGVMQAIILPGVELEKMQIRPPLRLFDAERN